MGELSLWNQYKVEKAYSRRTQEIARRGRDGMMFAQEMVLKAGVLHGTVLVTAGGDERFHAMLEMTMQRPAMLAAGVLIQNMMLG